MVHVIMVTFHSSIKPEHMELCTGTGVCISSRVLVSPVRFGRFEHACICTAQHFISSAPSLFAPDVFHVPLMI